MTKKNMNTLKQDIKNELRTEFNVKINQRCEELVCALFSDKKDEEFVRGFLSYRTIKTIGGEIKERVITAALKRFNEQYKIKIEEFIAKEEFIDAIISRINRKQLD